MSIIRQGCRFALLLCTVPHPWSTSLTPNFAWGRLSLFSSPLLSLPLPCPLINRCVFVVRVLFKEGGGLVIGRIWPCWPCPLMDPKLSNTNWECFLITVQKLSWLITNGREERSDNLWDSWGWTDRQERRSERRHNLAAGMAQLCKITLGTPLTLLCTGPKNNTCTSLCFWISCITCVLEANHTCSDREVKTFPVSVRMRGLFPSFLVALHLSLLSSREIRYSSILVPTSLVRPSVVSGLTVRPSSAMRLNSVAKCWRGIAGQRVSNPCCHWVQRFNRTGDLSDMLMFHNFISKAIFRYFLV